MLTDEDLDAIEARARAATAGPWYVCYLDDDHAMNLTAVATEVIPTGTRWPNFDPAKVVAATLVQQPRYVSHAAECWDEDADFIAQARADVPRLLQEVRRLRGDAWEPRGRALAYRLRVEREHYGGALPERAAIAWHGYLAAALEWQAITIAEHGKLVAMLPAIPDAAYLLSEAPRDLAARARPRTLSLRSASCSRLTPEEGLLYPVVERYDPPDPTFFGLRLHLRVGSQTPQEEAWYELTVCTPTWLAANQPTEAGRPGTRSLFVQRWDWAAVRAEIEGWLARCDAKTWEHAALKFASFATLEDAFDRLDALD